MLALHLLPERDCSTCTDAKKREWGCDARFEEDEYGVPHLVDGAVAPVKILGREHHRCPRRPVKDDPRFFYWVSRAYRDYQAGVLPHAGGLYDQPNLLVECLEVVDRVKALVAQDGAVQERPKGNPFADKMGAPR